LSRAGMPITPSVSPPRSSASINLISGTRTRLRACREHRDTTPLYGSDVEVARRRSRRHAERGRSMTSGRRDEQYVGRSDKPPENCTVVLVAAHVRFARCRALRAQHYLADAANVWCGEPHRSTSSRAPRSASGRVVSIMLLDRKGG
jgi:hypothetical protein